MKMVYREGDFSFLKKHREYIHVFEYDYKVIDKMGELAWSELRKFDITNTYITNIINDQLFPGHTAVTYRLSLNNLVYIANNGWEDFVENNSGNKIK